VTRLNIVVEGQAEETFVRELMAGHLAIHGVAAVARRVEIGRKQQQIRRGGLLDYAKLKKDVTNWLKQDQAATVTTMVDLFALPQDFPGRMGARQIANPLDKVTFLEEAFARDVGSTRFVAHVQLHEFEALLFTDIKALTRYYPGNARRIEELQADTSRFASPEEINEGLATAPSKRILQCVPTYDKVVAGTLVAVDLGLTAIRNRCAHFDRWLSRLEALAQPGR